MEYNATSTFRFTNKLYSVYICAIFYQPYRKGWVKKKRENFGNQNITLT